MGFSIVLLSMSVLAADPSFWKQWGDGQAELASYDLAIPRYGALRKGTAVTIFVTEPFSRSARVKADPGKHPPTDVTPVMKLNLVKDYQTGIYDYNEMTSAFVEVDRRLPLKVSFSRQEWCGHVYRQMLFDATKIRFTGHSYFDGEGDESRELPLPTGALSEDTMLLWARGFAGPELGDGESRQVPFFSSMAGTLSYVAATIERKGDERRISIGAAYQVKITVEASGERRILGWETSTGEKATLIKSARSKYWQQNTPEGIAELEKLGLKPRPARTM